MMPDHFPIAILFIIAGLILPLIPQGRGRAGFTMLVPIFAAWTLWGFEPGVYGQVEFLGLSLEMMRVDKLSTIFGLVFCLASFIEIGRAHV